jgi:hypothetical protein
VTHHIPGLHPNIFGLDSAASRNYMLDNNFFRPAASAQFYLDQAQQSFPYNNGGRISVSRDKQDAEEVEAYRASFGFSADEIVTTQAYVEIPDALDEGFSISPFGNNAPATEVDKPLFNVKVTTSPKKSADQLSNDSPHNVVHLDIFKGNYPELCFNHSFVFWHNRIKCLVYLVNCWNKQLFQRNL